MKAFHRAHAGLAIGLGEAATLNLGQPRFQRVAGLCQIEKPLTPVFRAGVLDDMACLDKRRQNPRKALFRDVQNAQQFADSDAGVAPDKIDGAVMGPPHILLGKD